MILTVGIWLINTNRMIDITNWKLYALCIRNRTRSQFTKKFVCDLWKLICYLCDMTYELIIYELWHVKLTLWHVFNTERQATYDMWQVNFGIWLVHIDLWSIKYDLWPVKRDLWDASMICDLFYLIYDLQIIYIWCVKWPVTWYLFRINFV